MTRLQKTAAYLRLERERALRMRGLEDPGSVAHSYYDGAADAYADAYGELRARFGPAAIGEEEPEGASTP